MIQLHQAPYQNLDFEIILEFSRKKDNLTFSRNYQHIRKNEESKFKKKSELWNKNYLKTQKFSNKLKTSKNINIDYNLKFHQPKQNFYHLVSMLFKT